MTDAGFTIGKPLLKNALSWFHSHFSLTLLDPLKEHFPPGTLTPDIKATLRETELLISAVQGLAADRLTLPQFLESLSGQPVPLAALFKRIVSMYRRHRATETEQLTQKTIHLGLIELLEQEVKELDALWSLEAFAQIAQRPLPRLADFLSIQLATTVEPAQELRPRQYDDKFHTLLAPHLFLPDMEFFRRKCEERLRPVGLAFADIDDFKALNTRHTETKVDRHILPRFMQQLEAHVAYHGQAYRQGGDEYLILLPSLSRTLCISFLDEWRRALAALTYPDIEDRATVSIGLCFVDPDCALTDREILGLANRAKNFAKQQGKNRIATYRSPRFLAEELEIVAS